MKKVYIVSSGSYSDYYIEAVFDSREKAEGYIASFGKYDNDFNDIEEYDLNPEIRIRGREGMFAYVVRLNENFEIKNCYAKEYVESLADERKCEYDTIYKGVLKCHVWARDEKHAIKIAVDRAREIKATVGWGNLINAPVSSE